MYHKNDLLMENRRIDTIMAFTQYLAIYPNCIGHNKSCASSHCLKTFCPSISELLQSRHNLI